MPVLVDGYNLLHVARSAEPERPPDRATICALLGQWAERRREKVLVVFDGARPSDGLSWQIGHPAISVEFSGAGVSADEVLIRMIEADSAARLLLVVSTDREIAAAAKRRRAKPIRADAFWKQVLSDLSRPERVSLEPDAKRRGLGEEEAERWLREFGFAESDSGPTDES